MNVQCYLYPVGICDDSWLYEDMIIVMRVKEQQ